MRPSLADRLRGIVQVPGSSPHPQTVPVGTPPATLAERTQPAAPVVRPRRVNVDRIAQVLGGQIRSRDEGTIVVIDRHYAVDRPHGRTRIGDIVSTLQSGAEALRILQKAWPGRAARESAIADSTPCTGLLFLDLETTGIAGGAGTQAFLVGCAVIEDDELLVRQFFLPGFEHERALLAELREWAAQHDTLVTFNGRTFDVPLIETRYLFHRLPFPLDGAPHIDMLHPARRLWKERLTIAGPPLDDDSCRLSVLERHLAGVHRIGDVPSFEIPSRYFRFVRDGDAFPLEAVLEHNRIDLVSLALVTARALTLIERGPSCTRSARECLGLGRLYERAGLLDRAEAAYAQAASLAARVGREHDVRADALRRLALVRRRERLMTLPACPARYRREAREALAIHHEHRLRDLHAAKSLVLDALAESPGQRYRAQAEHRLRRIERKLASREQPGLIAAIDGERAL
jgi:uncharacterized protein YprB with RNaseH-like and TPR domain